MDTDQDQGLTDVVRQAFGALIDELGFELTRVDVRQREMSATLRRGSVSVSVDHEFFYGVSVAIQRAPDPERGIRGDCFGLFCVLRAVDPAAEAQLPTGDAHDAAALAANLARQADLLLRHGRALLDGDFSSAPRLRRLQATEARRRNKSTFGTSTGESPRFKERPTLPELFSDATNEGLKSPRAYQAYWDHGYTLAEIAGFLGSDEATVQELLDQWDGL